MKKNIRDDKPTEIFKSMTPNELIGEKTKTEKEILKSLTIWHNNSDKRQFFIGELEKSS